MGAEFPRCAVCRTTIRPGVNAIFRPDGRVHHAECPPVVCPVCSRDIQPDTPIRRDDGALLHGNCWLKRLRMRAGMAAGPDGDLRATVRARLEAGTTPAVAPSSVRGRPSEGCACAFCGGRIDAGQTEYEVQFAGTVSVRCHRTCYAVWDEERTKCSPPTIAGGSDASPWTLMFDRHIGRLAARHPTLFEELRTVTTETCQAAARTRARSQAVRATAARLTRRSPDPCP